MSNNHNYQVFPHEIKPSTVTYTLGDWFVRHQSLETVYNGGGCLVMIILMLIIFVVIGTVLVGLGISENTSRWIGLIIGVIFSIGSVLVAKRFLNEVRFSSYENKLRAKADGEEAARASAEAEAVTANVMRIYESTISLSAELSEHISEAALWVEDAEGNYQEKAFSDFWNSIEDAARHLADYNDNLRKISKNAGEYYAKLSGRKHTFPSFPVTKGTIPDASTVLSEFNRVVRLGQTNFEFASIFEHRQTRKALISGFRSLGDAVSRLAFSIDDSMIELQQSYSSKIARVIEEEIKTRDVAAEVGENLDKRLLEQSRMLDNIQHGQGPK